MSQPKRIKIKEYWTDISLWQTEPHTEKILQQLNQNPEVVITNESIVAKILDRANESELASSDEDFYITVLNEQLNKNVENQMANKSSDVAERKNKKKKRKSESSAKKDGLNKTLIRLFGSPLHDLGKRGHPQPKKMKIDDRRRSDPVSSKPAAQYSKPLKISQKRRSEPVATITCKMKKMQEFRSDSYTQVLNTEYRTASEFVVPAVYTATAQRIETELKTATAAKKLIVCEAETARVEKSVSAFVDLTKDDPKSPTCSVTKYDGIKVEIIGDCKRRQVEGSDHSEKANVPVSSCGLSMPLLSPISPAVPAQTEAILPQETVRTVLWRPGVLTASSKQQPPPAQTQSVAQPVQSQSTNITEPSQRKCTVLEAKKVSEERPRPQENQNVVPDFDPILTLQQYSMVLQQQQNATKEQHNIRRINHSVYENLTRLEKENRLGAMRNQTHVAYPQVSGCQPQATQNVLGQNQQPICHHQPSIILRPKPPVQKQTSVPQPVNQQQFLTSAIQQQATSVSMPNQRFQALQQKGAETVIQSPGYQLFQAPQQKGTETVTQPPLYPFWNMRNPNQRVQTLQQRLPNATQQQEFPGLVQQRPDVHLPQLFQLLQAVKVPIRVVSNDECAEKILPHLCKLEKWRRSVCRFYEEMKRMLSAEELSEDKIKFHQYSSNTSRIFGRKLIQDLSTIDVEDFNVTAVLSVLTAKLVYFDETSTIYHACGLINLLIVREKSECNTPFLKRFYAAIELCNQRMKQIVMKKKQGNAVVFTGLQLQQLKSQIKEFWSTQNWLKAHRKREQRQSTVPAASPSSILDDRRQMQKDTENCSQTRVQGTLSKNDVEAQTANNPQRIDPGQRRNSNSAQNSNTRNSSPSNIASLLNTQGGTTSESVAKQKDSFQPIVIPVLKPQETNNRLENAASKPQARDNFDSIVVSVVTPDESNDAIRENTVPEKAKEGQNQQVCNKSPAESSAVVEAHNSTVKDEIKEEAVDEIIDLTWIEDADVEELEDVVECKSFPFKTEMFAESEEEPAAREVISPTDSGLGSPVQVQSDDDGFKCLCGKKAKFICACKYSMYCSRDCQDRDWIYHQKLCYKIKP